MHIRSPQGWFAVLAFVVAIATTSPIAGPKQGNGFKGQPVAYKSAPDHQVQKFRIVASDGKIAPNYLHVRRFKQVRIVFVSKDGTYRIRFKDFGIKEKLTPEQPVVVDLMPSGCSPCGYGPATGRTRRSRRRCRSRTPPSARPFGADRTGRRSKRR